MAKAKAAKEASEAASGIAGEGTVVEPKKSLWVRFKNEMIHYWHGTKLLGKEIKISTKLAGRLLNGNKLTRREQRQVRRLLCAFFIQWHIYACMLARRKPKKENGLLTMD
jgi:LETM1 and EF-hand domain-containing protein 1